MANKGNPTVGVTKGAQSGGNPRTSVAPRITAVPRTGDSITLGMQSGGNPPLRVVDQGNQSTGASEGRTGDTGTASTVGSAEGTDKPESTKYFGFSCESAMMDVIERQTEAPDAEIDRLVYDLYGLTEEEIAIVEKNKPPA